MNDYFSENSIYTETQFRRRFQMWRQLFIQIVSALSNHNEYFQMRYDVVGRMGLSPLQKCIVAIRIVAYFPVTWQDQYHRGDNRKPTIILEVVASQDLWVWHAFFGVADANNDINVLNQSPVFHDVL